MSEEPKKKLITVRTLTFSGEAIWPDTYEGMTLEEATRYEKETDLGTIIESLPFADNISMATEIRVEDV